MHSLRIGSPTIKALNTRRLTYGIPQRSPFSKKKIANGTKLPVTGGSDGAAGQLTSTSFWAIENDWSRD